MKKKTGLTLMMMCIAGLVHSGMAADTNVFQNTVGDNDWNTAENWEFKRVPLPPDIAVLGRGAAITLTTTNMTGALRLGVSGKASLTIDGGSISTISTMDWNSVGYNDSASLTIQNGGSLTFANFLMVGRKESRGGSVIIHAGTLRVSGKYFHNNYYTGTNTINTRTTLNAGGLLDVDDLILNAGVLDIAGGTLIVRQDCVERVTEWIKNGRIIAMSGLDGWSVKVILNEETGWTTLTAEQEEIVLGMLHPLCLNPEDG